MKTIISAALALVLCFGAASCKKEDNSNTPGPGPTPTVFATGNDRFSGEIDGEKLEWVSISHPDFAPFHGEISYLDAVNNTSKTAYLGGVGNINTWESMAAVRGFLINAGIPDSVPSQNFYDLFKPGTYDYKEIEAGIVYTDSTGDEWQSWLGPQPGSKFRIEDAKFLKTDDLRWVKAAITFNCKVYNENDSTMSKTITNGVIVGSFMLE